MMPCGPTVFVVDDDDAMRGMISRLLASVGLKVRSYASAEEFWEACDPDLPGCLVLDVRMPGMSGLELQDRLIARRIRIPIVFVTGHGDVPMAVHCLQDGAVNFIEKPFREQVLLDSVRKALDQDARRREAEARRSAVRQRLADLTEREAEVLDRVVVGKASKEIAAELGISVKAVEAHRCRIMSKMNAGSAVDLVRMVLSASEP